MGTMNKWLLFTAAGAIDNAGTSSIYEGNIGTNNGAIGGFQTLVTQPFGLFSNTPETATGVIDLKALQKDLTERPANQETAGNYGAAITTLSPGIYNTGGAISVIGTLTLDGQNNPNARFIIRSGGALLI